MSSSDREIVKISPEHELFVLGEEKLTPNFFGIWHRVQVSMNEMWMLYRDGKLFRQLEAGPHTWWTGFFHEWKIQKINLNIELIEIKVAGRVRGPEMSLDPRMAMPTDFRTGTALDPRRASNREFACEVTAELGLSCGITQFERFLRFRDPLSNFLASVSNMVNEMIGELSYDQYGKWATKLRSDIKKRLQGGSDDSERLIGMRVEEVYVTKFVPNSAQDRSMLTMYQLVEKAQGELIAARAKADVDRTQASSYKEQAETLQMAPSLLALQNNQLGKLLLERDVRLRELMLGVGVNPGGLDIGVSVQPVQDQYQIAGGSFPAQPPPSGQPSSDPTSVTGSLKSQPLTEDTDGSPAVDRARRSGELEALRAAGFVPAGSGSRDTREWTVQVSLQRPEGVLLIVFHCPAGYPASPPTVEMRMPGGGGLTPITPNTVKRWNPGLMLVDIAREIDENTP